MKASKLSFSLKIVVLIAISEYSLSYTAGKVRKKFVLLNIFTNSVEILQTFLHYMAKDRYCQQTRIEIDNKHLSYVTY